MNDPARVDLANHEAIAAAKAGVIGLKLSTASTYALRGIRVNCVAPGLVRTPMTGGLTANEASPRPKLSPFFRHYLWEGATAHHVTLSRRPIGRGRSTTREGPSSRPRRVMTR